MANDFYTRTFNPLPGQRVDEQVLKDEFQLIEQGFDEVESDATALGLRAIKLPIGTVTDQTLALNAVQRAGLVLAFDSSGNVTAISYGRWRDDWLTATAYVISDNFRYAPTGNIYTVIENHTSGVFATDLAADKFRLVFDVATLTTASATAVTAAATATTQAGIATTGASTATTQAGIATAAAVSAAASFDTFDDIFLGAKASDPTTDNDGNALQTGALYFNTTAAPKEMRVYDGSVWAAAYLPAAGYVTLNGTQTLTNKTISLTNNTVLAGNLPVIRPTLLLDFANSLAVDPRITFSRASTATQVNKFGLLELVASGASRIAYDPVSLACRGLMGERSSTNLFTYSEQLDNAAWAKASATITANATVAPDGATTADKVVWANAAAINTAQVSQVVVAAASTVYTQSYYLKAAELSSVRMHFIIRDGSSVYLGEISYGFDLVAGTAAYITASGTAPTSHSAEIRPVGGGYYRCAITATTTAGTGRVTTSLKNSAAGDGVSGFHVWGAQIEAGALTGYIPVVASQVTRAADVAVLSSISNWYRQDEGALLVIARRDTLTAGRLVTLSDGTANNQIRINVAVSGTSLRADLEVVVGGVSQVATTTTPLITVGSTFAVAIRYKLNDFAISVNGAAVVADTLGTVPTVDRMHIGSDEAGANQHNGTIQALPYYPKASTNTELQALSTL